MAEDLAGYEAFNAVAEVGAELLGDTVAGAVLPLAYVAYEAFDSLFDNEGNKQSLKAMHDSNVHVVYKEKPSPLTKGHVNPIDSHDMNLRKRDRDDNNKRTPGGRRKRRKREHTIGNAKKNLDRAFNIRGVHTYIKEYNNR